MYNRTIVIANLTRDPELRYTPQGTAVCNLRLAINRKYKSGEEMKEDTCFITAVAWAKTAENCNQYLAKGAQVFIEGRLQSRQWEKDNQKHSTIEIVVENIRFLSGKRKEETQEPEKENWLEEEPQGEV